MLNVHKSLVEDHEQNPQYVCVTCAARLGLEHNFFVDVLSYGNGEIVYVVIDQNAEVLEEPYIFVGAHKYDA